jgi:hypothetical protein
MLMSTSALARLDGFRSQLHACFTWHTNQQLRMTLQPTPGVQFEILLSRNNNDGAA